MGSVHRVSTHHVPRSSHVDTVPDLAQIERPEVSQIESFLLFEWVKEAKRTNSKNRLSECYSIALESVRKDLPTYLLFILVTNFTLSVILIFFFLRGLTEGTLTAMVYRPEIEERRKTG
jgi:hypothetical protein